VVSIDWAAASRLMVVLQEGFASPVIRTPVIESGMKLGLVMAVEIEGVIGVVGLRAGVEKGLESTRKLLHLGEDKGGQKEAPHKLGKQLGQVG